MVIKIIRNEPYSNWWLAEKERESGLLLFAFYCTSLWDGVILPTLVPCLPEILRLAANKQWM